MGRTLICSLSSMLENIILTKKMHSDLSDLRNIKLPVTIRESSGFISYNLLDVNKWMT